MEPEACIQVGDFDRGNVFVLVAFGEPLTPEARDAFLSWRKGSPAEVSIGSPTRLRRYFNDLDEAARFAAAAVTESTDAAAREGE